MMTAAATVLNFAPQRVDDLLRRFMPGLVRSSNGFRVTMNSALFESASPSSIE